ncbi:MAG TPA: hypothetical protein VK547_09715 [Candidatus Udaeobacter sp.]|nr:hypothetical protein [Candidatus Udaeobacter sp.]
MASEIEIVVRVKGAAQSAAEVAAVGEAAKRVGSSGGELGGVSKGMDDIGRSAEGAAQKMVLTRDANGNLRNSLGQFASEAERAAAGLDDLDRKAAGAGRGAASSSSSFAFLHSKVALLTVGAVGLAPALAALPAVASAAGLGAVTMGLAFSGVVKALHDYAAQSASSAQSGASAAATAFANDVAIRNGEQAIADARKAAAQSAVTSAAQIASAQQGVGDAERQAAQSAQSSADAIVAARQRVEQATYSLAQSQLAEANAEHAAVLARQALTQAEHDATNQIADLNNAMKDGHLAVEQATLNVSTAEKTLNAARSNSLLTADQKTAAELSYRQALQGLADAKQHDLEATEKADQANKSGAAGLASVTSAQDAARQAADAVANAQHGVASAAQAQSDAQTGLARAQESAANQQVTSNEQVAKAQKSLADAVASASQQQAASAETVRRAQQSLADTQTQQGLAAGAAGAANNKFADDLKKLTQPGRDFVMQVLSMKDGLKTLADTAQTATLPGFTQMLRDSSGMFPVVKQGIQDMGGAFGDTARHAGDLMKSSAFQGNMTTILKDAAGFAKQVGSGIVDMVKGVADAASKAGPMVSGLGQGFQDIMKTGIPAFFQGLTTNAKGSGQTIQGILDIVSNLLGPLGTLAGAFSGALGPALKDLAPAVGAIATGLVKDLLPVMDPLSKGLDSVAKFIAQNTSWLTPLVGAILLAVGAYKAINTAVGLGKTAMEAWTTATALFKDGSIAAQIATKAWAVIQGAFNLVMDANPIALVVLAIAGLAAGIVYAWEHFKGFRDVVQGVWHDLEQWFTVDIPKFFGKLLDFVKKWWPELLAPFTLGISEIIGHWGKIEEFFKGVPGKLASVGKGMWNWIKDEFKAVINEVIGWWNGLKFTLPSADLPVIGKIGGGTIGVPIMPPLKAAGGVASGLTGINEAGLEMVRLPTGSTVMPHGNTMSALAGGGGGAVNVNVNVTWDGAGAPEELWQMLRKYIRITAGNGPDSVQNALGQTY